MIKVINMPFWIEYGGNEGGYIITVCQLILSVS